MTSAALRHTLAFRIFRLAGAFACAALAYGQGTITTVAGGGFINNAPGAQSRLGSPQGVAVDASGNVYISDSGRILRLDHSTALLAAVAGGGTSVYNTSDGPALSVRMIPTSLAIDKTGNVLFLDSSTVRRVNLAQQTVTTLAGKWGVNGSTGDGGAAANALLNSPQQLCLDSAGDIYVVETAGYVRRVDVLTSVITTVAGNGGGTFSGDGGLATAATLLRPDGIAVDTAGNLYISDAGDGRVRKVSATTHIITTIAGAGQTTFSALGALAVDAQGNLSLIDQNRVRRIAAVTGVVTTVAGTGTAGFAGDGAAATQAELSMPTALALDSAGNLYIADTGNLRVRMVSASSGIINSIAGTSQNGDGGLAAGAVLTFPVSLAVNATGDLFIGSGNLIRKVTHATGIISTFAGGGASMADGVPATQALLNPLSLAFDSAGNLLVGQPGNIRRIDTSGTVTTIAGTGVVGFSGDNGPATSAQVNSVDGMALDSASNLFFADAGNLRVRRVDASTSVITTFAGNGQKYANGVGVATQTAIGSVRGLAVDSSGNLYLGGFEIYRVLKVTPSGTLSIVAGNGGCGYAGDGGLGYLANICQPNSIVSDASNNFFLGDSTCYCVRQWAAGTGIIQTVAGNGKKGYLGDNGPATSAEMQSVAGLALAGTTLYVADPTSGVVRAVTPDSPPVSSPPLFSQMVNSATFLPGAVAPGELVSLYGNYMGPSTPAYLTLGSDGKVTNQLSGVQVFFDDAPAPLIYVSAGQINAVAPYSVSNGIQTVRIVTSAGTTTLGPMAVLQTSAGVFPSAIVNADGSRNAADHPAPKGSVIVMYGTGLGQTSPAGVDGAVNPLTNFPTQVYPVEHVTISTNPLFSTPIDLTVSYAGPAPGLVEGVFQINAHVPLNAESGQNFLQISSAQTSPSIPLFVQ